MRSRATFALGLTAALTLGGCGEPDFTEAEKAMIGSLSLSELPPLPPDPTNRYAGLPAAAAFGATLFFEQRLSRDGNVSCATCHMIDRQFQDGRPLAVGVATTNRRTMPLAGVARSPWFFWDGRKDSLWAQALGPLEDAREHAGNRTAYAHFIRKEFGDRYERIFGPLPDLSGLPKNAGPLGTEAEKAAWNGMSGEQRASVDRVFANLGKAIAAFERSIVHEPTRFDRFVDAVAAGRDPEGEAALSDEEMHGLKLFIGKANCVTCHNGPRFTDDHFHNTGIPEAKGLPEDRGRETAVAQVAVDPFNCLGAFRDGGEEACGELRFMVKSGDALKRAYKTPLRGAATRPPYMHSGQIATPDDVVDHYNTAPASPRGTSELHPLGLSEREQAALVAFLKTLAE